MRFLFGLCLWFSARLRLPAPLEFDPGLPGCFPGAAGIGGPCLISGLIGFEALSFSAQLPSEGLSAGRAGFVVLRLSLCGLP